jgi:hypothetical protein
MNVFSKRAALVWMVGALASLVCIGIDAAGPTSNLPSGARGSTILKASNGSFSAINLTVDACNGVVGSLTVTATGTTDDGGGNDTIWFTIYDDGVQKFVRSINIPVGSTVATVISVSYPGQIGSSAPGIALVLGESAGDDSLALNDNFFPTQVGGCNTSALSVPSQSPWTLGAMASLLALLGLGALVARRRAR